MDFKALKTKIKNSTLDLAKQLEESVEGKQRGDSRYWKPKQDADGNAVVTLRFLPDPEANTYVEMFTHGFKGPTGLWYVENCLTTITDTDPAQEAYHRIWNEGDHDFARQVKKRKTYHTNIYVIENENNPEDNGKVFLWRFPKTILAMLNEAMNPSIKSRKRVNPYDMFAGGANFSLVVSKAKNGFTEYKMSQFEPPAPLGDDKEIQEIWKQTHNVSELVSPDKFKPREELEARLARVLGETVSSSTPKKKSSDVVDMDAEIEDDTDDDDIDDILNEFNDEELETV